MRPTLKKLDVFYRSPSSTLLIDILSRKINSRWPELSGQDVLGYGFCEKYLSFYKKTANRIILTLPEKNLTKIEYDDMHGTSCITENLSLPFSDSRFDKILCIHGTGDSSNFDLLLQEFWRVLKPEGQIIIISSSRSGGWIKNMGPFSEEKSFSRKKFKKSIIKSGFQITFFTGCIYFPYRKVSRKNRLPYLFEKICENIFPYFSRLVLVEAIKRLYAEPHGMPETIRIKNVLSSNPLANKTIIEQREHD
ncbi:MAG: methyltransferase domain-containing protein [Hellea sp.]|nr:methyltransferase domain-containing protein [Hellea sp.]